MPLLLMVLVVIFHLCNAAKDINVTYVEDKQSWFEARTYCQSHGGVLENNITLIQHNSNNRQGIWIGTYLSPWVGYYGCYQLNTTGLQVYLVEHDIFQCQMFCPLSEFGYFIIQGTTCYCVVDIKGQREDLTKCTCTSCDYFNIYKQNIIQHRTGSSDEDGIGLCIAAECITAEKNLIFTSENCDESYKVLCDKPTGSTPFKSQSEAVNMCTQHNSSLKWFTDPVCKNISTGQHWTSITRTIMQLSMIEFSKNNTSLHPTLCRSGKLKNTSKDMILSFENCKRKHSFFCRFGLFTNISAQWPGSTHDAHIFKTSTIGQHLQTNYRGINYGILLGDSGYPCRPFLLTPFRNPRQREDQRFNRCHGSTRSAIERTFGIWKRRFGLLHGEVRMRPSRACKFVMATAILHNIAIKRNEPIVEDEEQNDLQPDMAPYEGHQDGRGIREYYARSFFP